MEVGLVEISYPSGFTGVNTIDTLKHNVLVLEFGVVLLPVRHYTSFNDLYNTLKSCIHFKEKPEELHTEFQRYFNLLPHKLFGPHTSVLHTGKINSIILDSTKIAFPARVYSGTGELIETILSRLPIATDIYPLYRQLFHSMFQDKNVTFVEFKSSEFNKTQVPQHVFVYTDIIKPNMDGDSYVRLLAPVQFPGPTSDNRLDHPLFKPLEQLFIETIAMQSVTKTGDDVKFITISVPYISILHFKNKSLS
jgi:hypothetical protein